MRVPTVVACAAVMLIAAPALPGVARGAASTQAPGASAQPPALATMKELMIDLVFPTSDAIFYVARGEPKTDAEWQQLQLNALMLAESANVMMMPGRARDQTQWMADARLLLDVGMAAYRHAKAKNYEALVALNDQLYESCQSCHEHYRPGYRRRP